jgi:hypothetical protein
VKRLFSALPLLVLLSSVSSAGPKKYFDVYNFEKGVDTYHASASLQDGFVQNALNVCLDCQAPFTKRQGFTVATSTKAYSYTGLWTYVDGANNTWQIARSSDQLTASNLTGTIVRIATETANNVVAETNAFGNAYFVDQGQGVYYWNGTSTTYVSGSPFGSIITTFHNRIWVAGAAIPNINQLYGSKFGDGTTWTTGLNANDPVQYSVGLNDNFDSITALYVYLDTLYTFKHYGIFGLTGFDQTSFSNVQLTQECGCIDTNTIQTFSGGLKFVSARGVENFNGYTCQRISDPVKNKVDPATTNSFNTNSWTQQTTADWSAGTFNTNTSFSTSLNSPGLTLASMIEQDNSDTQWSLGTKNNMGVQGGGLQLGEVNGSIPNGGFESGSFSPGWFNSYTQVVTSAGGSCIAPYQGTYMLKYDNSIGGSGAGSGRAIRVNFEDPNLTTVYTQNANCTEGEDGTPIGNDCVWRVQTLGTGSYYGKAGRIVLRNSSTNTILAESEIFYASHNNMTFACASDRTGGYAVDFDAFSDGYNQSLHAQISSGVFTSASINTGIYNPQVYANVAWSQPTSIPGGTMDKPLQFETQTSADNATWSDLSQSTGVTLNAHQYIRYISTMTTDWSNQNADGYISQVIYYINASSGIFTSQVHNVSGINSFGNLNVNQTPVNGNIYHNVCTSASSNMSNKVCALTTPNSQILVATNTYVQFIDSFTINNFIGSPVLNLETIQWYSGTKSPPMASTVWDNRYWLSLATTTADTFNDAVLTYSSRGAWSIYDIHAGGFTQSKGNLYHADSLASGNVYQDNQGWADNGNPINAFIQTKDVSNGDIAADDYISAIYPSADDLANCVINFSYSTDKSTATYTLGSPNQSEFSTQSALRLPLPIDSSHQNFGKTFNFTIGSNDALCPLQLYGFKGAYKERPVTK